MRFDSLKVRLLLFVAAIAVLSTTLIVYYASISTCDAVFESQTGSMELLASTMVGVLENTFQPNPGDSTPRHHCQD